MKVYPAACGFFSVYLLQYKAGILEVPFRINRCGRFRIIPSVCPGHKGDIFIRSVQTVFVNSIPLIRGLHLNRFVRCTVFFRIICIDADTVFTELAVLASIKIYGIQSVKAACPGQVFSLKPIAGCL